METATLQTPKTGKSRFSKALPAPPSFLKALKGLPSSPQPSKTHLPPARKPLPAPKESATSPTSPSSAMSRPLDSPLPPVPLNTSKPSPPLPSIPRRPVAAAAGSPGLSSPDDSPLSSLLSAYTDSNRSSDSTHLSSHDGATPASSAQESYQASPKFEVDAFEPATTSPKLDELFFAPLSIHAGENNGIKVQEARGQTQDGAESDTKQRPPPPFKDFDIGTQNQTIAERTTSSGNSPPLLLTQTTRGPSPETAVAEKSPQSQPQIWRRRSLKAEKNLAVTELKLVSSNGSTTSTSSAPAPAPPPKETPLTLFQAEGLNVSSGVPAATRSPLPTPNAAFPGRNIRPVGSRQQLAEDGAGSMGQEASRVKNALKKSGGSETGATQPRNSPPPPRRASPPSATTHTKSTSISSPVRLPTPEYDTDDFKVPAVETIVSPVSPAASPELPSEPRPQRLLRDTKDVAPIETSRNLALKSSSQGLNVRSPVGLPSSPSASRTGSSPPRNQFPARTTSKPVVGSPVDEQGTPKQKARTISEVGSIETIRAPRQEQYLPAIDIQQTKEETLEDDHTDHPGAARFPRGWWKTPVAQDTVFPAPPIAERHYQCLKRHRVMIECRSPHYPQACQTCQLKDASWRYVCGWCNLRICKSCRNCLKKHNGDLHKLLEHNDDVIVEQSTELEFDHEEAAIQSGKAAAAQKKASA